MAGIDRKELIELIVEPEEEKKPLMWLIWQAAEKMIKIC